LRKDLFFIGESNNLFFALLLIIARLDKERVFVHLQENENKMSCDDKRNERIFFHDALSLCSYGSTSSPRTDKDVFKTPFALSLSKGTDGNRFEFSLRGAEHKNQLLRKKEAGWYLLGTIPLLFL
jgi:hypothetical protein